MTESKESTNKPNAPEQESDQSVLNRRQFIGFGASAAAAALAFPKAAQAYIEFPGMPHKTRRVTQKYTSTPPAPPTPSTPATLASPSLTPPSDTSFVQPNVIASKVNGTNNYGTLASTLDVVAKDYTDLTAPPTPMTYVRAFNQVDPPLLKPTEALAPGPTLCVNPGDEIQLQVANNLPKDDTSCPGEMNKPNCFNTINMHFHGLHVSPISLDKNGNPISAGDDKTVPRSSDDVLYELQPDNNTHAYCPWLPAFHAPGTHWYHAHRHGSTAIQVAGGMVGALIVKEPPGQEICPGAPDVVMIIQEEPQSNGNGTPQENLDLGIYTRSGFASGTFRVNGKKNPTLNLKKDEIQRWRIINGNSTPRAFMNLELQDASGNAVTLYRIAVDGITLYGKSMDHPSVNLTKVPFAPGNRVDLLINLDSGASTGITTYTLWKKADTNAPASSDQLLVTINVDNETTFANATKVKASFQKLIDKGIPNTGKPAYLDLIPADVPKNTTPVVFQATRLDDEKPKDTGFRISNKKYSSSVNNIEANLNSTQEWIVANTKKGAGSRGGKGAAHPFHIHVNPFLVVATADIPDGTDFTGESNENIYSALSELKWNDTAIKDDGTGIDPTVWWDTFTIAPNKAYKIRHRFDDYWGTYVLHCHVLIHEDQGMMWNVNIKDVKGKGANPCQQLLNPVEI